MSINQLPKKPRTLCKFTQEEDNRLRELVLQFKDQWVEIANRMPNRNIRQCRERWQHYLCCTAPKKPWTPEEDQLLMKKVHEFGTRWRKIFPYFINRTDISCKLRWLKLISENPEIQNSKPKTVNISANNTNHTEFQENHSPEIQIEKEISPPKSAQLLLPINLALNPNKICNNYNMSNNTPTMSQINNNSNLFENIFEKESSFDILQVSEYELFSSWDFLM